MITKDENRLQIICKKQRIMATTKFYLDSRAVPKGKAAPLKLAITKKGETSLLHLNVQLLPSQWDKKAGKISNHPNKLFLNTYINKRRIEVDTAILMLTESGQIGGMRAKDIKDYINGLNLPEGNGTSNLFAERYRRFAESKTPSTKGIYMHTYSRMSAYASNLERLTFEDITKEWLTDFEAYLAKTSPSKNARNVHLRNIRAVFNDAIDDEVTTAYPFRRFKIRPVATAKRSLSLEQLRSLFHHPADDYTRPYLDMFKLTFFLIGINTIDLCRLKEITLDCRVEYHRAKTGRFYSVKVEPEALEIINRYRGEKLLLNVLDNYSNYKDYAKHFNRGLKNIGDTKIGKNGQKTVKPLFPNLTTYWARHTWATLAAELEIPKETIAAALGHGGNTVTDIYIDFDRKKVDIANRRVINWVLYGKRK